MKKHLIRALALCAAICLIPAASLAASKKKAPATPKPKTKTTAKKKATATPKPSSKEKAYSLWVNRNISAIQLNTTNKVTTSLTKAALNKNNMTLFFSLQGGKKHASVTVTNLKVDGKSVKENRAKGIVLTGYLSSDNGTAAVNFPNAKLKDVQFSLQISPYDRAKKYTIGPFKLSFKGDFAKSAEKAIKVPLSSLDQGEPVPLLDQDGVKIQLNSVSVRDSYGGDLEMLFTGRFTNTTGKNVSFSFEQITLNGKEYYGFTNIIGIGTPGMPILFNLSVQSVDEKVKVPQLSQLKSGSFTLRVKAEQNDLALASFELDTTPAKTTPVKVQLPGWAEKLEEEIPLLDAKGVKIRLLGATVEMLEYNTVVFRVAIENQSSDTVSIALHKPTINGASVVNAAYWDSPSSLVPGASGEYSLFLFNRVTPLESADAIRDLQFFLRVWVDATEKNLVYAGPYQFTIGP
ncbi:MAG: hypothetical protein IJ662_12950 [Clostridia bacterium]|nr:hypothetical protein [Clostridia bacterium]